MRAFIVLVDGFEEIEAIAVIDILRRANVEIHTVSFNSQMTEGSHKIKIMTDKKLDEIDPDKYDAIILPGGKGYKTLLNSAKVLSLVKQFNKDGKIVAAICAAPTVLAKAGVLEDRIATVYPGLENQLPRPREGRIVIDKNIITSRSPGTAIMFALKILEKLKGKTEAEKIKNQLVI